ncbi:hypothetical protein [Leifsonia sp. 2MCAF36]|uniref:hypothetical protein n=1 Tax=Leifsonia sp. 2MCAF36 TaxID=3232988 RepID=UPI003F97D322
MTAPGPSTAAEEGGVAIGVGVAASEFDGTGVELGLAEAVELGRAVASATGDMPDGDDAEQPAMVKTTAAATNSATFFM